LPPFNHFQAINFHPNIFSKAVKSKPAAKFAADFMIKGALGIAVFSEQLPYPLSTIFILENQVDSF
jgi:hypothetical protein